MKDDITEIKERTRRIETKLSRFIAGEDDRGVTNVKYKLSFNGDHHELHLHTPNVTLLQVSVILTNAGIKSFEEVDIYDDGRFLLNVMMR